jgi:cellulose synthase (UDP-forming)
MPPDGEFELSVAYSKYSACMSVNVTHVEMRKDGKWKYCVNISKISAENKRQYYQIIYDRHHTLADKIADGWSMLDDYTLNLTQRLQTYTALQRLLPRISTDMDILSLSSGKKVKMTSFNYRYMTLIDFAEKRSDVTVLAEGVHNNFEFRLTFQETLYDGVTQLYRVENWEELLRSPEYSQFIDSIITENGR